MSYLTLVGFAAQPIARTPEELRSNEAKLRLRSCHFELVLRCHLKVSGAMDISASGPEFLGELLKLSLALIVLFVLAVDLWAMHQIGEKNKRAEVLVTTILSLVRTLVGAALALWYAHSVFEEQEQLQAERRGRDEKTTAADNASRKVDRTLHLKCRFDSDHTYQARLDADLFLRLDPSEKLDALYGAHFTDPGAHAIFLLISFYEQFVTLSSVR